MENSNQNKKMVEIPPKVLKEKGILKILNVIIPEDGEDLYNCVMETGEVKLWQASELLE